MLQEIKINLNQRCGTIKALHGVNNGPVCYGELIDVSHHYEEAGIPLVRLHDPNWPYPREVDISAVFPDFSRDPEDPASYDFSRTDTYIRSVLDTGAKIVYRLGQSIEHTQIKYYVHPPQDYDKWARICLGIIRHYNEGWADGFHYNIEYWEIWNEPDNGDAGVMWSGTAEQYYELYRAAATAIKARFPELKVGGFAVSQLESGFLPGFLAYCRKHELPLDFFSWHTYTVEVEVLTANAALMHGQLVEYGYGDVEVHLNEWNYADLSDWKKKLWSKDSAMARRDMFEKAKGVEGASFCAAGLIALQDARVDAANYYDGQPSALFCGLFDYYGVPQKTFYAFAAFNELVKHPHRVAVTVGGGIGTFIVGDTASVKADAHAARADTVVNEASAFTAETGAVAGEAGAYATGADAVAAQGVYACAGTDDSGQLAVLISNPKGEPASCKVIVDGFAAGSTPPCTLSRVDSDHEMQTSESVAVSFDNNGAGMLDVEIPGYGVVLIRIG